VLASHAREAGALTIAVVTMPFAFEGPTRRSVAETALAELRPYVDTLLVIENDRVMELVEDDTSLSGAFHYVNDVLGQTVRAVVDIMAKPGLVNLDFADVCDDRATAAGTVGIGRERRRPRGRGGSGGVASPLLAVDLHGARAILLHVAGSRHLALRDVVRAAETVREAADPEANLIFGATFDDHLKDEVRVTVIATRLRQPAVTPPTADHDAATADRARSADALSVPASRSGRGATAQQSP
jgi:cell division protein FtsZ